MIDTVAPDLVPTASRDIGHDRVADLAQRLVEAIEAQVAADPGDRQAIAHLVVTVFGATSTPTGAHGISALIEDEDELSRIVDVVLGIVGARQTPGLGPQ